MTTLYPYPPYQTTSPDKILNQIEPVQFTQGETLKWSRNFTDYPATAGWTLRYVAVGVVGKITINSQAPTDPNDSAIYINVPSATSEGYTPGFYEWQAYVISADGSEKHQVLNGVWTIQQSFDALSGDTDTRTHARKVLDAIEAVIEGRATKDQYEYQIQGRMLRLTPLPDLIKFRQLYKAEMQREIQAANVQAGIASRNKIVVRFNK
jgi:hypothetical protein